MAFLNLTGTMGVILKKGTEDVTGSLFLTCMLIVILVTVFFMLFRVPVEISVIFEMPLLLVLMAELSDFLAMGGLALIYLAILFVRTLFIRD